MFASPWSAKHRSSSAAGVSLTPRRSTPWLRTSRTPASIAARAAMATSGVTDWAWLTWVWMARLTPRSRAVPALREGGQGLGGQADVADGRDVEEPHEEAFEVLPGDVGDVSAGDDHVAYAGVLVEVVDHRVLAVLGLQGQLELVDGRRGVADEVHAGPVAA